MGQRSATKVPGSKVSWYTGLGSKVGFCDLMSHAVPLGGGYTEMYLYRQRIYVGGGPMRANTDMYILQYKEALTALMNIKSILLLCCIVNMFI